MSRIFSSGSVLAVAFFVLLRAIGAENPRREISMDREWLFSLGDTPSAETSGLNDSAWRKLDVPHDCGIEGPFDEKNPAGGAGGFLPTGVGWYRKHFTLPADYSQKRIFIDCDGVMANSDVWINGFHLGKRPYGYVSFRYELTDHLNFGEGKTNVVAVRADNLAQPASRWYAGAGIYRHVRLVAIDRTGRPRPRAFERQSWWSDKPIVYICRRVEPDSATPNDPGFTPLIRRQTQFSDWTPRSTEPHDETVEVYSNCEQVELILNKKSLGSKALPPDASPRTWKVPFERGTIRAIGKNKNRILATFELQTAGKPSKILLKADRANFTPDWDDLAYVEAAVVDHDGLLIPDAADLISSKVTGAGSIAAVDNGDNSSHESFHATNRHAYQGRCFAIIKADGPGNITVETSADGLATASTKIRAAVPRK